MKILFEAKAIVNNQMFFYNIYRLQPEKYKAELVLKEDTDNDSAIPTELVLIKNNAAWLNEDNNSTELSSTLGAEIDVFNNGYGDLLGRIGVR